MKTGVMDKKAEKYVIGDEVTYTTSNHGLRKGVITDIEKSHRNNEPLYIIKTPGGHIIRLVESELAN